MTIPLKTISLVLIDDNRLLREGLAGLIREQPDFEVLAASADIEEVLEQVREVNPRVVLLDFSLEKDDSLRVTGTIHQEVPAAKIIVMGLLPLQADVADFVTAGASGFIMKDASFDEFLDTIRTVAGGTDVLPPQLTGSLFLQIASDAVRKGSPRTLDTVLLTAREREVIGLISEGNSNHEIAVRLDIPIFAVQSHIHHVREKLTLHTWMEVAAFDHGADAPAGAGEH